MATPQTPPPTRTREGDRPQTQRSQARLLQLWYRRLSVSLSLLRNPHSSHTLPTGRACAHCTDTLSLLSRLRICVILGTRVSTFSFYVLSPLLPHSLPVSGHARLRNPDPVPVGSIFSVQKLARDTPLHYLKHDPKPRQSVLRPKSGRQTLTRALQRLVIHVAGSHTHTHSRTLEPWQTRSSQRLLSARPCPCV